MPSTTLTGGGTAYERFQERILGKIYGGTGAVLQGHLENALFAQNILIQGSIFNRTGERLALAEDTIAGEDSHVAGS